MAKGKKGKGKASNLTDEERFQKEQEKAAAEEAERIAQQQMILNYLKQKLAQEEKYSNYKIFLVLSASKRTNTETYYAQIDTKLIINRSKSS